MRKFFTDRTPPDVAATYDQLASDWLARWSKLESRLVSDGWRNEYVRHLQGNVLEIGTAAGDTLLRMQSQPHDATSFTGIDISDGMLAESHRAAAGIDMPVSLHRASAEQMPMLQDASFDTVAASLVFCTIPDVRAALAEITRVLKPGGRLVLVEHVLAPNPVVAWLQRLLAPVQIRQMGCHLDRKTVDMVRDHGFQVEMERKRILGIFRFIVARSPH